jgi:hypothetical protein
MNSIKKKIVAVVTGLTLVVMMAPGIAQGLTAEELQAQINTLMAQLATLQSQLATLQGTTAGVTGCTITSFDRNLKQGMTGDDVKCLQIILNSDSATQVAATGAGSPGNETSYFGSLTKAAVVKFQENNAADILTPLGLTAGTGFVGAKTLAKLNAILTAGAPAAEVPAEEVPAEEVPAAAPAAPGLTVALASDTPAAGTIVAGSSATELAKFTFTNGDAAEVKVTQIKVKRIGISDDTTLEALYLFDGYTRLGDEATLSSGYATFNNAAGIFTVAAGKSKTISLRADIKSGVSGQTVGIEITASTSVVSNASALSGTFPISGNLMSVATATTPATATLGTATPAEANIDATNDFIIWSNTLAITQQDVKLEYLRLTQIGSISADGLNNIRLDISGTEVATSSLVAGTAGQDLIFDLSASPVSITKGQTKTLTVTADIVGGASKTLRMGLEKTADIFIKDTAYGNYVKVSGTVPSRSGIQTINTGTITMTKATDSPVGSVVNEASNVSLAKINVKANGEEIKINTLRVRIDITEASGTDVKYLRNGTILLDGVQVGGTSAIATDQATTTYTDFSIYQKIAAGTTKVLEVKADIYGCTTTACATNVLAATDQIQVEIVGGDLDNAQGMVSLNMIDAPSTTAEANTLTVGTGTLTLIKNPAYGNQSTAPGSDTKIGSFVLTSAQYDTINISRFTVGVSTTTMALTDLSNLYVKYGTKTTTAKGSVASSNAFSVTESLAASKSMSIDVWATIKSTASSGTVASTLAITASKAVDGSDASVSTPVDGQTITMAAGTASVAKASDSPESAIVTGLSTEVLMGKFTFSALHEAFTVSEIKIKEETSTNYDNYISLYLKYKNAAGETVTSDALPLVSGIADFTGLSLYVANGGTSDVSVYANLNAVAVSGYANSGDTPKVTLDYYKASSGSQPVVEGASPQNKDANAMLLYKTKPTINLTGVATGTLSNGVMTIYPFTIAADAKGDVGVKYLTFNVALSGVTATSYKFYRGATDISSLVTIDTSGIPTVTVEFTDEEVITKDTSQTYYLKATVSGVDTVGDNIQTYIKGADTQASPAAYASVTGNVIWTDRTYPAALHSENTADWINGYLVKTLPSDTYTLQK